MFNVSVQTIQPSLSANSAIIRSLLYSARCAQESDVLIQEKLAFSRKDLGCEVIVYQFGEYLTINRNRSSRSQLTVEITGSCLTVDGKISDRFMLEPV